MNNREGAWLAATVATCSLLLAGNLIAQPKTEPAASNKEATPVPQNLAEDTNTTPADSAQSAEHARASDEDSGETSHSPIVVIGKDAELRAGETTEAVVVIGGSAKIHGKVLHAVVVIGGDIQVDGEVGEAAVAVLGNIDAKPGARIYGDAVAVGGSVDVAPGAKVSRTQQNIQLPNLRWLRSWFVHCALLLRPLSLHVGWAWAIAGAVLLFYLLVAAVFPRPVEVCANELLRRPATSFLVGLLTILLIPFLILLLAVTGVGLIVVPFVFAAVLIATIVGKVSLLEWIGFKIGGQFGDNPLQNPIAALLVGAVIILLLYLVPVLGLATFAVTRVWGLGAAVLAGFGGLRREIPEKSAPTAPTSTLPPVAPAASPEIPSTGLALFAVKPAEATLNSTDLPPQPETPKEPPPGAQAPLPPAPTIPVVMPEVLSHPRAGFWERMGAGFLDVVLICVLAAWVGPFAPVVALAYFAGMWTWKQTTIGGIVLGLKVARLDGGPITFAVALVRALAAGFSIFVLFLGFLWIAWDKDKQGWHDKIAGTVTLKLPRGTPLVCL